MDSDREKREQERARSEKLVVNSLKAIIVMAGVVLGILVGYVISHYFGTTLAESMVIFLFGMVAGGLFMSMLLRPNK